MISEPESPAVMRALLDNPDLAELLLHQRAEEGKRWDLIHSLLYMGRHAQARAVANSEVHLAHIDAHQQAIEKPDDEECACEHAPTILQPLKHRVSRKAWSEKHNGIVNFYQCHYCQHENARPTPPDQGHDLLSMLQGQREANANTGSDRANRTAAAEMQERLIDDRQLVNEINQRASQAPSGEKGGPG